jgi:glycine/D-amino acid oxidase-like deaminating enzyme
MPSKPCIVIVGGGVIGSAAAYFLGERGLGERGLGERVAVVERDPSYRRASSALSASSIRQQFSTPINIALSQYGIAFLRGIGGEVGLVEPGYLYLGDGASATALARNHAIQRACGAPVALLSPAELRRCFPWLGTQGLALGSLGLAGEGWFDGYALLQLFRRRAIAAGVRYVTDEAIGFERRGDHIAAIRLAAGGPLACDVAVNAAGPWAGAVAALGSSCRSGRGADRSTFSIAASAPPACRW